MQGINLKEFYYIIYQRRLYSVYLYRNLYYSILLYLQYNYKYHIIFYLKKKPSLYLI